MIRETLRSLPNESLRFGYTDDHVRVSVQKNIERVGAYIEEKEKIAREFAAKSGVADISIEKLNQIGLRNHSLRWEAQMAVYNANLAKTARSRRQWLTTIRDHGVFVHRHEDGRALLLASEVMLLVEPFDAEQLELHCPEPIPGHGLNTVVGGRRGMGGYQEEREIDLADAMKL